MFNPKQLQFALKIWRDIAKLLDWVQTTSSVNMDELWELHVIHENFYNKFVYKNVPEFQNKEKEK